MPVLPSPPDSSAVTVRATLKTHLAHLRARAQWSRNIAVQAADIAAQIDSTRNEITVLTKAAKIALVNLGNVSRSLQRAFTDTEVLAESKIAARRTLVSRVLRGTEVLGGVKVHPVFGKEEVTLGEFFVGEELRRAMEVTGKTNAEVEKRIGELKAIMNEFIMQGEGLKAEVMAWEPTVVKDAGQVRELNLIADKIDRGTSRGTNIDCRLSTHTVDA
jgi:hypothetical protein